MFGESLKFLKKKKKKKGRELLHPNWNSRQKPKLAPGGLAARFASTLWKRCRKRLESAVFLVVCTSLSRDTDLKNAFVKSKFIIQEVRCSAKWREFLVHRHNSVKQSVSPAASRASHA